jgi:hypothetical protein
LGMMQDNHRLDFLLLYGWGNVALLRWLRRLRFLLYYWNLLLVNCFSGLWVCVFYWQKNLFIVNGRICTVGGFHTWLRNSILPILFLHGQLLSFFGLSIFVLPSTRLLFMRLPCSWPIAYISVNEWLWYLL